MCENDRLMLIALIRIIYIANEGKIKKEGVQIIEEDAIADRISAERTLPATHHAVGIGVSRR